MVVVQNWYLQHSFSFVLELFGSNLELIKNLRNSFLKSIHNGGTLIFSRVSNVVKLRFLEDCTGEGIAFVC